MAAIFSASRTYNYVQVAAHQTLSCFFIFNLGKLASPPFSKASLVVNARKVSEVISNLEIENVPALKGLEKRAGQKQEELLMKRAVSLITETAAWLTSLSGALAQKYICTKTKIQLHKDKNTSGQRQKYNFTQKNKTAKRQKYNYTQKIQLHKDKNTTTQRKNGRTPFPKLSLENINRPSITFFQCLFSNEEF